MIKNGLTAFLSAALAVSCATHAESIPFNLKMSGNMAQGLEACGTDTMKSAEQQAVRGLAEKLNGGRSRQTDRAAEEARDCCVDASKFLQRPKDMGNGLCTSIVRVMVSERKVERALHEYNVTQVRSGKPRVVGAVIRYMVDGEPVGGLSGYSPQDAVSVFESVFQEHGFRTANLTVLLEDFSLQRFGKTCAITTDTARDCTAFESYTNAVQTVLDRTRWARHNDIPDVKALSGNGWVAIGEVKVQHQGLGPSGLLHQAIAHTNIRLYRISDGEILAVAPDKTEMEKGLKPDIAAQAVMFASVGKTAERLALRFDEYRKLRR